MKLIQILESVIFEAGADNLKKDYVDSGKIPQEVFDKIVEVANNQYGYALWLIKRVIAKVILPEDIYKYKEYLSVFSRHKGKFQYKDINDYKTYQQVREFVLKCIEILEAQSSVPQSSDGDNLVSPNDILKLKKFGIEMIGKFDGYQCFKTPTNLKGNEEAWKTYKKILGDAGGKKIAICTIANFEHWNDYIEDDNFYIFFNKNDDLSPYQFGYKQKQFKDKNDTEYVYEN